MKKKVSHFKTRYSILKDRYHIKKTGITFKKNGITSKKKTVSNSKMIGDAHFTTIVPDKTENSNKNWEVLEMCLDIGLGIK